MKVSIIISNRNDLVMLNITLHSAIQAMIPFGNQAEIILVDNSDKEKWEIGLPAIIPKECIQNQQIRIFRQEFPCFTEARMEAARQAKGEYVFCVDSHVLFGHNTLVDAVNFMDKEAPANIGFGHPPLSWEDRIIKHWTLDISKNGTPWGEWANKKYSKPGKIFWKFMPWICHRKWYLETLKGYGSHAKHHLGWGGAEMLQQIKSLMLGYENWAIVTQPIIHIGPFRRLKVRLDPCKYKPYKDFDNYPGVGVLVAFYVFLGEDGKKEAEKTEYRVRLRRYKVTVKKYWDLARKLGREEYEWLKVRRKYTYSQLLSEKPWLKP